MGLILVTGATGRQGGAVARALLAAGQPVRAMSRHADSAAARRLATAGASVVQGDFDDAASLARAVSGVSAVFSVQTPYEAGTEQEVVHGIRLAEAAAAAGVAQFVHGSVASADRPTGVAHFESKGRIEQRVRELGFGSWTMLRPTLFMEMLLSPGNLRALARGRIELALDPATRVAMIAVDDIARMALAAFLDPTRWHGAAIELAGDMPNFTEVAAALGAAVSREITYTRVAPAEIDPETRPKPGTQHWLETVGWPIDLERLRQSYPFEPRTIRSWAAENAAAFA